MLTAKHIAFFPVQLEKLAKMKTVAHCAGVIYTR